MPLTLQQKKGFQPINHHFWPVIVPRREFVKYLAKIGMKIIFGKISCVQTHAKIPFNLLVQAVNSTQYFAEFCKTEQLPEALPKLLGIKGDFL